MMLDVNHVSALLLMLLFGLGFRNDAYCHCVAMANKSKETKMKKSKRKASDSAGNKIKKSFYFAEDCAGIGTGAAALDDLNKDRNFKALISVKNCYASEADGKLRKFLKKKGGAFARLWITAQSSRRTNLEGLMVI